MGGIPFFLEVCYTRKEYGLVSEFFGDRYIFHEILRYKMENGKGGLHMKNNNKWVVSGVLFFGTLIFLIYTMLEYRDTVGLVLGASAAFLIMTGVVINQACIAVKAYQQKQKMLLESRISEIQNMLMAAGEETQKNTKANVFYTKKIGEALAGFEDELLENQRDGNALLQRVISTQTKSTKVLVKYNEKNTNRTVSSVQAQGQQITQAVAAGATSRDSELRHISENVVKLQSAPQPMMYQPMGMMPQMPVMPQTMPMQEMPASQEMAMPQEMPVAQEPVAEEVAPTETEQAFADLDIQVPEVSADELFQDLLSEEKEEDAAAQAADSIPDDILESVAVPALTEEEAPAPAVEMPDDPNAQLSPDQIAALFAAAEPVAEPEPAPAVEMPDDPNAQLSPDQIAALFAAAEPVAEPEPAPAVEMPDDPNAQLSPDQIAALFAQANG